MGRVVHAAGGNHATGAEDRPRIMAPAIIGELPRTRLEDRSKHVIVDLVIGIESNNGYAREGQV